jgi:hypothetical protein
VKEAFRIFLLGEQLIFKRSINKSCKISNNNCLFWPGGFWGLATFVITNTFFEERKNGNV